MCHLTVSAPTLLLILFHWVCSPQLRSPVLLQQQQQPWQQQPIEWRSRRPPQVRQVTLKQLGSSSLWVVLDHGAGNTGCPGPERDHVTVLSALPPCSKLEIPAVVSAGSSEEELHPAALWHRHCESPWQPPPPPPPSHNVRLWTESWLFLGPKSTWETSGDVQRPANLNGNKMI